ncbi:MAG: carbohydrate binding domain-containing protein [Armatimonadota bacterium]
MTDILRYHQLLYITVLVATCMLMTASHASQNLILNPSFEEGGELPDGWEIQNAAGSLLTRDAGTARTGSASARIAVSPEGADGYPAFKFAAEVNVKEGEQYKGEAWARTKGIKFGAYIAIEFYKGVERLTFDQGTVTGLGDNEWTKLTVHGVVPPGTETLKLTLVTHGEGRVWYDDARLIRVAKAPREFHGDKITLSVRPDKTLCKDFLGFGAQGDYHLTQDFNIRRGVSDDDRRLVMNRVRAMRPHIIRTFFDYKWWEPEEGHQTFESDAMRDYVVWVRFLKGIGCKVMLCPWGDYFAYSNWMKPQTDSRLPSPEKRDAMVRSLADLVRYLRVDQGLTNVSYVVLMNEPDAYPSRRVPVDEFARLSRLLDRMLQDRGIRKDVSLVGMDGCSLSHTEEGEWFYDIASQGIEYADVCASHTYGHKYVASLAPWINSRIRLLAKESGRKHQRKPFIIAEFNIAGDTFRSFENHTYEHGLFLADFAAMALREKTAAVLMWCLFDTYYDDTTEQEYGLWQYKDKKWEPRPGFYSWSLITRYTCPGSRVVAVDSGKTAQSVRSVALISPKGELTILAVNRYARNLTARVTTGLDRDAQLRVFRYTRDSIPTTNQKMIDSTEVLTIPSDETVEIQLPAESFVLLTDLR